MGFPRVDAGKVGAFRDSGLQECSRNPIRCAKCWAPILGAVFLREQRILGGSWDLVSKVLSRLQLG